jgi:hypothetical protein
MLESGTQAAKTETRVMNFGYVKFIPFETFFKAPIGGFERAVNPGDPPDYRVGDDVTRWPHVTLEPTWQDGLFTVDGISDGTFVARLTFNPKNPDAGLYEIRWPDGRIQRGRSEKIISVAPDEVESRLAILAPFAVRYGVVTYAFERPHPYLVWLVGLNHFSTVGGEQGGTGNVA